MFDDLFVLKGEYKVPPEKERNIRRTDVAVYHWPAADS